MEYMHGYLARDCTRVPPRPDEDELLLVERYTLEESMQLVREGEVEDAKSPADALRARTKRCRLAGRADYPGLPRRLIVLAIDC